MTSPSVLRVWRHLFGSITGRRRSLSSSSGGGGSFSRCESGRFTRITGEKKGGERSVATTATTTTTTTTATAKSEEGVSDASDASSVTARHPTSTSSSSSSSFLPPPPIAPTTRVSETRVYYPGQTYDPSELEGSFASVAPSASQKTRRVLKKGKDLDAFVARAIDWKDAKMLSTRFVSETGKIVPRRQTGLGAKTHRLVVKNIKIARIMGVLPFTDRLPQFARRRKNPYS